MNKTEQKLNRIRLYEKYFFIKQINIKKRCVTVQNLKEDRYTVAYTHPDDTFDICIGLAIATNLNTFKSRTAFIKYCNQSQFTELIPHKNNGELVAQVSLFEMYKFFISKENYEFYIEKILIPRIMKQEMTIKKFNDMVNTVYKQKRKIHEKESTKESETERTNKLQKHIKEVLKKE